MFSRFKPSLVIGLITGLAFCGVFFSAILQPIEEKILDLQQKLPISGPPAKIPIVFVGIEDLQQTPWPWPRLDYTLIANEIRRYYPKLVAFEVPLDRPDTLNPIYDSQLANYIGKLNLVVLAGSAGFSESDTLPFLPDDLPPISADLPKTFLVPHDTLELPMAQFRENAAVGLQNLDPDSDGVVRNIPLFIRVGSNIYSSFSLQCFAQFVGAHWPNCKIEPGIAVTLCDASGEILARIPMDWNGQTRLRFRGDPISVPRFEFKDVLLSSVQDSDGSVPKYDLSVLRGKLVLIGRNHPEAAPLLQTPYGELSPAKIHLNALVNFFSNDFIQPLPMAATCAWILVLCLLLALLPCWTPAQAGLALCWTLLLVTCLLSFILFDAINLWTPTATLLLAGFCSWLASVLVAQASPPKPRIDDLPPLPRESSAS